MLKNNIQIVWFKRDLRITDHRPLFEGKVIATAEVIKVGKRIASIKGELFTKDGKLATTLIHSAVLVKAISNLNAEDWHFQNDVERRPFVTIMRYEYCFAFGVPPMYVTQ